MTNLALNRKVSLEISGETGVVIGKAEYVGSATLYQVHYKDALGCAKTDWFYDFQLNVVQ